MNKKWKNYDNIIKLYKKDSIFFSYWKKFLAILMVPIIIVTSVVMFFYNRTLKEQRNTSSVQFFSTVSNAVNNMIFYETDQFFNSTIVESEFQSLVQAKEVTSLNETQKKSLKNLEKSFDSYISISNYITAIQVHLKSPGYVITSYGNNYEKYFNNENWYSYDTTSYRSIIQGNDNKSFYISYNLYDENKVCGKFVFTVSPEFIYSTKFNENITTYDIVLTNLNEEIVFTTDKTLKISEFSHSVSDKMKITTKSNLDYITRKTEDINIRVRIKYDNSYQIEYISLFIFSIIISLLLSAFIAFCVALISYKSISGIMHEFNETIEHNENTDIQNHEINYIIDNITEIKNKNLTLEQELITNFASLNNLQLEMLQMQVTPHFLFNVLNNINFLVMAQNGLENPISDLIYRTSVMLTNLLDTSKFFTDLRGEFEICENYIEIQKVAYNNIFDVRWNTDEKLMDTNVPKFILQPLLENAFKHGVKSMDENDKPYIEISVYEKNGTITFKTVNNTNHIDEEKLSQIRKNLNEEIRPNKTQIGLLNLNKRIKLIYGSKYGCNIYSKADKIVTIAKIPLNK